MHRYTNILCECKLKLIWMGTDTNMLKRNKDTESQIDLLYTIEHLILWYIF